MPKATTEAVQRSEILLREMKEDLEARNIWPNMRIIIQDLLNRRLELVDVSKETYAALAQQPRALYVFWDAFLHTADGWSPEKIRQARKARGELTGVNAQISELADQLAVLLDRRDHLHNHSGFRSGAQHHIVDFMHEASEHNYLYECHVKEKLDRLTYQYDLKYWPSLSEVIQAIGADAEMAEVTANSDATAAATESRKSGLSDFVKALQARLDDCRVRKYGCLPNDFALSDSCLASLVSCGLDLSPDELVDADFMKRFRQRQREAEKIRGDCVSDAPSTL